MSDPADYQALDGLPAPVLVVRGERIVHANPALLQLLGIGLPEVLATPVLMLLARFSPEDQRWLEPMHTEYTRGKQTPHKLWVRVRVAEEQERTYCMSRGEGVRAEDTLLMLMDAEGEASTRRLTESLVEAAGALLHCRDEQGVLETAVEAIHRHGFSVMVLLLEGDHLRYGPLRQDAAQVTTCEVLYGKPLQEIRFPRSSLPHIDEVLARHKAAFHSDFLQVLENMRAVEPLAWLRRAYPSVRALDAPIFVQGKPYGILSVQGETLTPTSAATLELFARQVGGALENVRHHRLAASRLAELSRLQSELVAQERLTVLGEAAGVVAHEVRNPLGAILNAVAVLKRDRLGPVSTSAVRMLEEEATRLDAMVRDLLDVVRPMEPRPRPLHPGELARRTLELLRQRHQLGTLQVSMNEAPDLPMLQGDEMLLQLALENLLRNAVQASPPEGRVTVSVSREPEGVLLTVEDEGSGISPADIHRIFEPFFTTRATGTGLGLAVVRRVVLAHGGTVSAGQRPGGGARFELRLPLPPAPMPD
ncbi:ATP-binding protein [Cystobacter ferrugineus]|uniref:histidine kinase n=1 Tax=Cystobacter ferrugineus TaxID=83449 RepID=A0A1L9BIB1_9BACT|nr:ATP-binding protein [Cystobacter ferrugineus]OJH41997.1 histidine kinase [Cystobacter ferrugineus]